MKKRILSLLCVLALCLGLLPVTALAEGEDAPDTLWVGETQITGSGYWTTDADGKLSAGNENNYNVYYDGNGTLTLKDATIQGRGNSNNSEPQDYGIYAAPTGNQSVSLTIKLIGSNTVKGYSGIYVGASGGDSTLVIQSDGNDPKGSLEANGSGWNGITISSYSGNAFLTINNASVVANSEKQSSHGVSIKSRSSTELSLTVNGGSLTAKGTCGIFYSSLSGTNPSTSLTVSDSALIKAIPNISASVASKPTPQGNGIVFDGTEGTVYGDVTLDESLTIDQGETLTIPEGSTLNTNGNLTNNGTITVQSGGTLEGTPTGNGTVEYKVTGVTLDKTELSLYTGESEALTATVEPANATNQDVTWENSNPDVATVVGGTVTAVKEGEATIAVTTVDGGYTATCKVKVTQATYSISIEGSLDFGEAYTGYDRPAAQTVTITNTGNQTLTLEQPASTKSFEVGNLSKTQLAPDETATFTVQPKADLAVGSYKESINLSGSNGNNTVFTSVDATFAVVDINSTQVKTDLTVTPGITEGIAGTAFDTPEAVKAELTRVLVQDAAYTAGNTAFYDVKLQYSLDGGQTWFEATEATFPTEGITVTLPYPSGTDKDTHNFRVVHMFTETSTRLGTTAGNTETPAVTKTDSGLQVTLRGLSPVVIGWDKIETPSSGGSTTPAATATPAPSDNITYYTCPSCGYHNWTATEAGYRCDHCGYLESTRQLSGYGNVKGSYTPGSSAAAPAASTIPQTGDESNPVLWTVLLLVSGLALGGLAIAKRKKQQ